MVSKPPLPAKPHHLRTILAAFCGALAIIMLLSSVLVVWLNRTLTDTPTFVATVGPIVENKDVQNFVADKVTEAVTDNVPVEEAASQFLPADELTGKTTEQLKYALQQYFHQQVLSIVNSDSFAALWRSTLQSTHSALITQLDRGGSELYLDLRPVFVGVMKQLDDSGFGSLTKHAELPGNAGKISLKGNGIERLHEYYEDFKAATWFLLAAGIIAATAAVILSVHHAKTSRRMLVVVGVCILLMGMLLSSPMLISTTNPERLAAFAVASTLFRNLQITCLTIGLLSIGVAVGWKIVENRQLRPKQKTK